MSRRMSLTETHWRAIDCARAIMRQIGELGRISKADLQPKKLNNVPVLSISLTMSNRISCQFYLETECHAELSQTVHQERWMDISTEFGTTPCRELRTFILRPLGATWFVTSATRWM